MGVLEAILAEKRAEIALLRERPIPERRAGPPLPHGLARAPGEPLRLIAEIKRRSPSAGSLSTVLAPAARGVSYEAAGASAISVLTDARFFDGSFDHLHDVAAAVRVPVLCKDFVLHPAQIALAASCGASLVLLIVRVLDGGALGELAACAISHGLTPLVEVQGHDELDRALAAGASLVGVNARDLDTLAIDRVRAAQVLDAVPPGVVAVHLSGIASPGDVRAVPARADAALLGEALMRQDDPTVLLGALVSAARQR